MLDTRVSPNSPSSTPEIGAAVCLSGGPYDGQWASLQPADQLAERVTLDSDEGPVTYVHGGRVGAFEPSNPWKYEADA
jgi:hypothetical protein